MNTTLSHNKMIRTLLTASTLWFVGEGMLGPLLSLFTQQIGGNTLDVATSWSVYLIVTGIFMVLVGLFSDRIGSPARLMLAGYLLNALATFGYLLVTTPQHLMLVQALLGIANALATPTWDALFTQYTPQEKSGAAWGVAHGQEYVVTGLSIMVGSYLVYYSSFQSLFILMGTIQVFALIVQSRLLRGETVATTLAHAKTTSLISPAANHPFVVTHNKLIASFDH